MASGYIFYDYNSSVGQMRLAIRQPDFLFGGQALSKQLGAATDVLLETLRPGIREEFLRPKVLLQPASKEQDPVRLQLCLGSNTLM